MHPLPFDRTVAAPVAQFAQVVWNWDWELFLKMAGLSILTGLGIWCSLWAKRWLGQQDGTLSAREELKSHQSLLEQGLLTQEEFDRVKARLESQDAGQAEPQQAPAQSEANKPEPPAAQP